MHTPSIEMARRLGSDKAVLWSQPKLRFRYVRTDDQLTQAIDHIRSQATIGLDIETASIGPADERSLPMPAMGIIALIQVGVYDADACQYLIDPFLVDVGRLGPVLAEPDQVVIIQNAPYEYEWLAYHYGFTITNVLDTCRAWRGVIKPYLTRNAPGYTATRSNMAQLVKELLALTINKDEQTSDWAARPLSAAQLRYGAWDVAILGPLADATLLAAKELGLEADLRQNLAHQEQTIYERFAGKQDEWAASDMSVRVRAMADRCHSNQERRRLLVTIATLPIFHGHRSALTKYIDAAGMRSAA